MVMQSSDSACMAVVIVGSIWQQDCCITPGAESEDFGAALPITAVPYRCHLSWCNEQIAK